MKHSFRPVPTAVALLFAAVSTLWQPPAARAVPYSFSGALTLTDPIFNRPVSTTTLSGVGTAVFYDVQRFSLTLSSSVTLTVDSATFSPGTPDDSFLALYQGAFNPASPLTNLIAVDDDSGPGFLSSISAPLLAGTNYFLVTTAFANGVTGPYNDTITPANAASVVVVPEPSTWAMAVGGLGVLMLFRRHTRCTA